MIDQRPDRLPAQPPTVSPPPPFAERRVAYRRAEDRIAHQEKVLLARALDVLASDSSAEERLAGLLRLLARTVGARRAAVVADGIERRAAVAVDPGRGSGRGRGPGRLARRPRSTRSRADRAASGRAPISFIVAAVPGRRRVDAGSRAAELGAGDPAHAGHRAVTTRSCRSRAPATSPSASSSADRPTPSGWPTACRRPLARHAAVALALVTSQLATERELAALRARDAERTTLRLDGRPRAADAADRPARLSRADPRRPGRRPGRRARLPRAEPVDRRLDGRARRRPARAVAAGVGNARPRDRAVLASPRPAARSRPACCRSRSSAASA